MSIPMINYPAFRPYTNITPFTVRDGATYLLQIETLLAWIRNDLVPHIDKEIKELQKNWDETAVELISTWEQMSADLIARVEQAKNSIGAAVDEANAAKNAAEAARDIAEMFAGQMETLQDQAITTIFNNGESLFRTAFESSIDKIKEDENDPGTFIIVGPTPTPDPAPGEIVEDPSDPGFFI